jgi:hypothetical protein
MSFDQLKLFGILTPRKHRNIDFCQQQLLSILREAFQQSKYGLTKADRQ